MVEAGLNLGRPLRIVLIGADGAGKTSLFNALCDRPFDETNSLHVNALGQSSCLVDYVSPASGETIQLELVDTESHRSGGRRDMSRMNMHNYEGADVVILCLHKWGFRWVRTTWLFLHEKDLSRPGAIVVGAVTCSDIDHLPGHPDVTPAVSAEAVLQSQREIINSEMHDVLEVSAKTGQGIKKLLDTAVNSGLKAFPQHETAAPRHQQPPETSAIAPASSKSKKSKECVIL